MSPVACKIKRSSQSRRSASDDKAIEQVGHRGLAHPMDRSAGPASGPPYGNRPSFRMFPLILRVCLPRGRPMPYSAPQRAAPLEIRETACNRRKQPGNSPISPLLLPTSQDGQLRFFLLHHRDHLGGHRTAVQFLGHFEVLIINTGTTIVTFLMVFLIQNTQNRDGAAIQAKLDELIRASTAQNRYIGIEELTEEELSEIRKRCQQRAASDGDGDAAVDEANRKAARATQAATR